MFIVRLALFSVIFGVLLLAEDAKNGQTEVTTTQQSENPRIQRWIDLLKKVVDGQNTTISNTVG